MNLRLVTIAMALACGVAYANARDPPEVVARVSHVTGHLLVESPTAQTSERGTVNWPITSGDRIQTDDPGRAELNFGTARVRLDAATAVQVVELDRAVARIQLASGSLTLHLQERAQSDVVSVQAGHATIDLLEAGDYRIDVFADGGARIVVHAGRARTSIGKARFAQGSGEQARIASDDTLAISRTATTDSFDQWSLDPERHPRGLQTARHVAQGLVGYEDLDAYGSWRWERNYGMVWEPRRVARDWAPYRFGQWIWKQPWGWTWVDDAPWGFAPFHYGRWIDIDAQWLWVPGPRQIPAVYGPALVSLSLDSAGREPASWYPLAPEERYVPPYPASDRHIQALNTFAIVSARAARSGAPSDRTASRE